MVAFGPVPFRRLGRGLGINNIPPKACSYSCVCVDEVLGLRLGQGIPVEYGLDGLVVPGGWPAGRAIPRRLGRHADVVEHPRDRGSPGDEGDDAHSVRYRVNCRRSCPQGRRPLWGLS